MQQSLLDAVWCTIFTGYFHIHTIPKAFNVFPASSCFIKEDNCVSSFEPCFLNISLSGPTSRSLREVVAFVGRHQSSIFLVKLDVLVVLIIFQSLIFSMVLHYPVLF